MKLTFENVFSTTNTAMIVNRSHPEIEKNRKWLFIFICTYGPAILPFLVCLQNIINYDLKNKNFSKTCQDGILCLQFILTSFQYVILFWKKKPLNNLIRAMKKDYADMADLSSGEQNMIIKYAVAGVSLEKQWIVVTFCGLGTFVIKNIILYVYNYIRGEFYLIPIYDVVYPTFIESRKHLLLVYMGTYVLYLYFGMYSCIMLLSFVPLGPIFMLHACGKLSLLTLRLEKIFDECKDVSTELRSIIVELQDVYSFVDDIKDSFRVAYELTLKVTTIALPITAYEVLEAYDEGEIRIEFITFMIGGLLISSSPCFFSELLIEKGEIFRQTVYSCHWERRFERKTRRTLLLLQQRSSRPIAIRTIFRTVCLDTLTDLFHQAFAIFNLMRAVWK